MFNTKRICPVPFDISINHTENTIKQFTCNKFDKNWLGDFLGDSLADFYTKTSGHPAGG
jgi:hypothetical protein